MPTPTRNVRRFFGLDTPRVTLTPYLRSAPTQGEAWRSATPSPAASASSPSSAAQTWAPVNTVANQDDLHELVNKIRFLASMGSEDRPLILEVCDRASTDVTAREAIRALMHEFKHGSAAAQLSAARLWAILLRNSSAAFISQSTAADFLEAIEALLASPRTSLVVRHRVLRVLGDAVYSNPQSDAFRTLWLRVKPADELLQGAPYNDHDAILRPAGYVNRTPAAGILDRISPAIPQLQRSDWRFPYAWEAETEVEAPPPSYETATGTMLSQTTTGTFGTESAAGTFITESAFATLSTRRESHFYESPDHTVLLNISARRTQDEESDSDSDSVENRESDSSPFRTPVLQISPPPAGPRVNLDLDLSPLRPSATRDWSSLAPNSATATQVTSRPTAIRRLPLVQADNRSNAVASSSRPAAVSPPQNAAPRKKGIYLRTLGYLRSVASTSDNSGARTSLDCFQQAMGSLTTVSCLVYALQYRDTLAQISEDLGVAEHPKLKAALAADQAAVADTLLDVLYSPGDEQAVLALEGDAAQSLLDIVQDVRRLDLLMLGAVMVLMSTAIIQDAGQRPTAHERSHVQGTPAHREASEEM
ncbi:hypothetical protein FB451DRAFT_366011 [Mycena latifolia]|nr:hypothetical protein FB451DRAFT_366011 [Mycena latifolia]